MQLTEERREKDLDWFKDYREITNQGKMVENTPVYGSRVSKVPRKHSLRRNYQLRGGLNPIMLH